jgi:hypothetical protein
MISSRRSLVSICKKIDIQYVSRAILKVGCSNPFKGSCLAELFVSLNSYSVWGAKKS